MKDLYKKLEGKKTYLAIGLLFVLGGLKALGLVDEGFYQSLFPFLVGLTGFGLRAAINR